MPSVHLLGALCVFIVLLIAILLRVLCRPGNGDDYWKVRSGIDVRMQIASASLFPKVTLPVACSTRRSHEIDFLVDTGAQHTMLPAWYVSQYDLLQVPPEQCDPPSQRPPDVSIAGGDSISQFGWGGLKILVGEELLAVPCIFLGPSSVAEARQLPAKKRKGLERSCALGRVGVLHKYTVIVNANRGMLRRSEVADWLQTFKQQMRRLARDE